MPECKRKKADQKKKKKQEAAKKKIQVRQKQLQRQAHPMNTVLEQLVDVEYGRE